jgi:hypothetical protein
VVKLPFRRIRAKESVVVVNARASSAMRWSGFAIVLSESSR